MNDLKADEFTAPSMGRPIVCLITVLMVLPLASASYSNTQITEDGTAWFDCDGSWASIHDSEGIELVNDSDFTISLDSENHTIYVDDMTKCQGVIPLTEELPNSRPIPGEEFFTIGSDVCPQDGYYMGCEGEYTSGDLIDDPKDIFAIDVNENHMLVLTLVASSASIDVELHFQTESGEVVLIQNFSMALNTSIGEKYVQYVPIEDDGRVIVTVSSPQPDTIWSMRSKIFATSEIQPLTHLDNIVGVGPTPFAYVLGPHESLTITKSMTSDGTSEVPIKYRYVYSENSKSEWNVIPTPLNSRINVVEDIQFIEFQWDCECEWIASMSRYRHFDAGWGRDAPGLKPMMPTSDNSSYPLIDMDGHSEDGELTLQMGDFQDVLRVETTGWNESTHLVNVIVEGDIYDLQVTIWNMDQETWEILGEVTTTYSMDRITASLNVGLGTHYIKIEHINGSDSLLENNSESVKWNIRITTAVLDEGDQPWFPASDAVKDAADLFYWLIGLILILPFIIFYINVKKEQRFAEEFSSRKNRLDWLRSKLDDGEYSSYDLSRALKAVSTLEWEKALEVWGKESVRHYTMGIDMAVWTLDKRLGEDGTWPLLIGLRPLDCEWSVAALRFEAPEGEAWSVSKTDPKMLTRDDEIFLDTINDNSRVFIRIDLQGNADALNINLSGMVDGEPMAAKPANTIYRSESNSEE